MSLGGSPIRDFLGPAMDVPKLGSPIRVAFELKAFHDTIEPQRF
jgi:hypothetical protein